MSGRVVLLARLWIMAVADEIQWRVKKGLARVARVILHAL